MKTINYDGSSRLGEPLAWIDFGCTGAGHNLHHLVIGRGLRQRRNTHSSHGVSGDLAPWVRVEPKQSVFGPCNQIAHHRGWFLAESTWSHNRVVKTRSAQVLLSHELVVQYPAKQVQELVVGVFRLPISSGVGQQRGNKHKLDNSFRLGCVYKVLAPHFINLGESPWVEAGIACGADDRLGAPDSLLQRPRLQQDVTADQHHTLIACIKGLLPGLGKIPHSSTNCIPLCTQLLHYAPACVA
mmetsp:Transcript_7553/g.13081  ORF Transcript_7553/g.13081 Transcript_7553/m.13081 type:complete len:241 (-) Transcript_7553:306-1028(-)